MIAADQIAKARDADILDAAAQCGAQLRREGPHYVGACPAGCATHDGFVVTPKKQIFLCRPSGAAGDVIEMVSHALGAGFTEAIEFLTGAPISRSPQRREARAPVDQTNPYVAEHVADILAGLSPVRETAGEAYLKDERRIDVEAIAGVLEKVDALGWHPSVYFNDPGHALHGQRLGCIVGIMTDAATAQPTGAISRTYLDGGCHKVGKAKTLGAPAGIVRLSEDADVLEGLHLAEGIETALAAMAIGLRPIWSTGSTALLGSFPVLAGIECLTILADHDANGAGEKAARLVEAAWLKAGREVRILRSGLIGDLNDAAKKAGP